MKIRPSLVIIGGSLTLAVLGGCASPQVSNNKKNHDDLALLKEDARQYERKDGNLRPDYVADLLLNGTGRKTNKPAFDQPRGNDAPTR
jgi:hypothetical protein